MDILVYQALSSEVNDNTDIPKSIPVIAVHVLQCSVLSNRPIVLFDSTAVKL